MSETPIGEIAVSDSILASTKKALGIHDDYTDFDHDVIMHINTVFTTLNQLGIGPAEGFMIQDRDAVWVDYLGPDVNLNSVKTYIFLRVKLLFDPPTTSFHIQASEKQVEQLEWRLNVKREGESWQPPVTEKTEPIL